MGEKVHMIHATSGAPLCGTPLGRLTTGEAAAVTCPLCGAMIEGRGVVERLVDAVQAQVTGRLTALQRDPAVRVLTEFARSVVAADGVSKRPRAG